MIKIQCVYIWCKHEDSWIQIIVTDVGHKTTQELSYMNRIILKLIDVWLHWGNNWLCWPNLWLKRLYKRTDLSSHLYLNENTHDWIMKRSQTSQLLYINWSCLLWTVSHNLFTLDKVEHSDFFPKKLLERRLMHPFETKAHCFILDVQ